MKNLYILSFLLIVFTFVARDPLFAATVGNPLDLDIPKRSAILREEVINNTLDEYEQIIKIKAALDVELIFEKELDSSIEIKNAEIQGQYFMGKLGITFFNRIEPYIKVGLSHLEARWKQADSWDIEVDADEGLAWGGGLKGVIWEFDDLGLRITGDAQYRTTESDVSECSVDGVGVNEIGADFEIKEWQASIILSKKFELPLKWQSIFIVPYTGVTVSDSKVDIKFDDPSTAGKADYDLFDASNDSIYGFIIGCDIMPALTSTFIYSMELRLFNEMALTLGGAMKF